MNILMLISQVKKTKMLQIIEKLVILLKNYMCSRLKKFASIYSLNFFFFFALFYFLRGYSTGKILFSPLPC